MIAGIGVDIVEINRIKKKLEINTHFVSHVFTQLEIEYCKAQKYEAQHFAVRWAAKEAFLKAFGIDFIGNHRLTEIEILNKKNGKPFIQLHGQTASQFIEKKFVEIHITLSHTAENAVAYIMITK